MQLSILQFQQVMMIIVSYQEFCVIQIVVYLYLHILNNSSFIVCFQLIMKLILYFHFYKQLIEIDIQLIQSHLELFQSQQL